MPFWSQLGFQDALSPVMEEMIFFHDFSMMILCFIMTFVGWLMMQTILNSIIHKSLLSGQLLECIWTMLPVLILVQIALPSLVLLYLMETPQKSFISLKALGHQWYWSYELGNLKEFDSIMVPENDILENQFRLLEVDNRVSLPFNCPIRVLVGSEDVLHSWTIPSLGVKVDANPGRLNQLNFVAYRPSVVYGQCSEICGANHSFMPIVLEFISSEAWMNYILAD